MNSEGKHTDERKDAAPISWTGTIIADGTSQLCSRTWWVFLIGGLASVAFGILAFINPGVALLVLGIYLAAFLLVDGVANIWGAVTNREKAGWWMMLILGLLGVAVGGYALAVPVVSVLVIVYMVSFMAMLFGVSAIYLGWKVRQEISTEWLLYLSGALSILFSGMILWRPVAGTLSVVYLIAAWAIVIGLFRIGFALQARKLGQLGASEASASP